MTEDERTRALANPESIDAKQLIDLLEELRPDSPEIPTLDIDALTATVDPHELSKTDFTRLLLAIDRLRKGGAELDLSQVRPNTFARLIGRANKTQLSDLLDKPELRTTILNEIFRRMGEHLREDRAASVEALVHWRFTGGSGDGGYDRYETLISEGSCTVGIPERGGAKNQPRVSITLTPADFLQLISGKASAPLLFVTGKLKVKGDLAFAAGLMGLFDLPKAD